MTNTLLFGLLAGTIADVIAHWRLERRVARLEMLQHIASVRESLRRTP